MGVPGSPGQETLVSGLLQLCVTEMSEAFLFLCLKATKPVQTQGMMCHQPSSPKTHRDVLAQGRSCVHISCRCSPVLGQLGLWACRGRGAPERHRQAGQSVLCTHHSCLALGMGCRVRAAWFPVASTSRAAAAFPGSCRFAAGTAGPRCSAAPGGQRPQAINCPALPYCPSDEGVCPGAVSEEAAWVGGDAPPHPGWGPQPWLSSRRGVRVVGGVRFQCVRQQECDVPLPWSSQGTAESLPSHLENLIHANYAAKSPSDNEYEMEV